MSISQLLAVWVVTIIELSHAASSYTSFGKCPTLEDGSMCFGRPWQYDGVCLYVDGQNNECVSPVAQKYSFTITVKYRPDPKYSKEIKAPERMYIRGSGPGLSWEKSRLMKKSLTEGNTWLFGVQYTSDFNSLLCTSSSECSLNQGALEFRIYTDQQATKEMKGPNFYFPLPLSNSASGSKGFKRPTITVYPWFTRELSQYEEIIKHPKYPKLKGKLVYPPSFKENTYKRYPLVVLLEDNYHYIPQFDYQFVKARLVEEVILLMIKPDELLGITVDVRDATILPFDNLNLVCKTASSSDCTTCQICWNSELAEPCDKEEFIARSKKCLYFKKSIGVGERLLADIISMFAAVINEKTSGRVKFNPLKERITLFGHGEGAVLAFVMGLSRPDLVKNIAVLSPKFHLPLTTEYKTNEKVLQFMNNLTQALTNNAPLQALYASQKYYISHGEHDDTYFPIAETLIVTEKVIKILINEFKMKYNDNLIFQVVPGEYLKYPNDHTLSMMSLLQTPMVYFHKAQGGPSEKYARGIVLKEEFFANRQIPPAKDIPTIIGYDDGLGGNEDNRCTQKTFSMPVFIGSIGGSVIVSVLITVVLMCLREGSRDEDQDEDQDDDDDDDDDDS